jgi:hypothetical protein
MASSKRVADDDLGFSKAQKTDTTDENSDGATNTNDLLRPIDDKLQKQSNMDHTLRIMDVCKLVSLTFGLILRRNLINSTAVWKRLWVSPVQQAV